MRQVLSYVKRSMIGLATIPLGEARRKGILRRIRGKEEARRLEAADCVVVSFGKSGRTWLRVMLSRFFQRRHGLPEGTLIGFDNLHRKAAEIPRIFFTHDNYLKDFTGNADDKVDYRGKRVILLARNPADVAVSQFFQWKYRMRPHKKMINDYPTGDVSVFDFVAGARAGIPKIVDFMNTWAAEVSAMEGSLLLVRYEDMRTAPEKELARMLEFIGSAGTDEEVSDAVEFAAFENMRKLETKKTFKLAGSRMKAKDNSNPHSFKTRRGKVGGFRDYFDDEQVAHIEAMIQNDLAPWYGYRREPEQGNMEATA